MLSRLSLLFLPTLLLASCANAPDITSRLSPYRIDVRQGNFVTQEMVAKLKPGMTREQVRFLLGTPLVSDVFHANRWDYVYRFQPGRGEPQQRRLSVFFEDDKLVRVGGDVVAAGEGGATETSTAATGAHILEVPAAAEKKD